jgi:hypothetical protein
LNEDKRDSEVYTVYHPAPPLPNSQKMAASYEAVNPTTKLSLEVWCTKIWNCDFKDAIFSPVGILSDGALEKLASMVSPIQNLIGLECLLGGGWVWFGTYGDKLLAEIKTLPFNSMHKQKQKRVTKWSKVDVADEESLTKQMCVSVAPTPVRPTMSHSSPTIVGPLTPMTYSYPQFPQSFMPEHPGTSYYYPS